MRSFNKHFTYFHIQFRRRIASQHGRLDAYSYCMLIKALVRMTESSYSHNNGHRGRSNWLQIYQRLVSNSTPIQGGPASLGLLMCPSRDGYGELIGREARYPGAKARQARCLPTYLVVQHYLTKAKQVRRQWRLIRCLRVRVRYLCR
jgi:hypothetical protein